MTPEEKSAYWQQHFSAWEQSGLSQREYCEQHDLKLANFAYWRTRNNRKRRKLLPIAMGHGDRVVLDLPYGIRLEVPESSLRSLLPVIIRSLREAG